MKFALSPEQTAFAASLDDLLSTVDGKLWRRLADLGVTGLGVPEHHGGLGADVPDLMVAFEALGFHCVPGAWTDTVAVLPALLDDPILGSVASGEARASVAFGPHVPYALDADLADIRIMVDGSRLRSFTPGDQLSSIDSSRRLFEIVPGADIGPARDAGRAFDLGVLATAAQLLGAGRWLLDTSVAYAGQRRQYGREIGKYQAVKHLLADVVTALELARPLLYGAAVTLSRQDVSAAKVACGNAALLAARTGLQVHGAIGYTAEHPLGARLLRVRALASAWGTAEVHRRRILAAVAP